MITFWSVLGAMWAFALTSRLIHPKARLKIQRHRLDETTDLIAVTRGDDVVWVGSYAKDKDGADPDPFPDDDEPPDWVRRSMSKHRN